MGSGANQRNMGTHSLRHIFVMTAVARESCGFRNATPHELKKDARMKSSDTLATYMADNYTIIEANKSAGKEWGHLFGSDYRSMYLKKATSLAGVGKSLDLEELPTFAAKYFGDGILDVKGFVAFMQSNQDHRKIIDDYNRQASQVAKLMDQYTSSDYKPRIDSMANDNRLAGMLSKLSQLQLRVSAMPKSILQASKSPVDHSQPTEACPTQSAAPTAAESDRPTPIVQSRSQKAVVSTQASTPAAQPTMTELKQVRATAPHYMSQSQLRQEMRRLNEAVHGPPIPRRSIQLADATPALADTGQLEKTDKKTSVSDKRKEIMVNFQNGSLEDQVNKLMEMYTEIDSFKELLDEDKAVSKQVLPDSGDREFFRKKLKPVLQCYMNCCARNLETFKTKNFGLPDKKSERIGITIRGPQKGMPGLKLRNWAGKCACKASSTAV